jgi:hypothetical protein
MRITVRGLVIMGLLLPCGANAGLVMTQVHVNEAPKRPATRSVMRLSIEGDHARSDMVELSEQNPILGPGSYVLLTAGKRGMIIVNPDQRAYMRMDPKDMRGLQQTSASMEKNMQQSGEDVSPTNLKVDKKLDEPGPTMLGVTTRHLVYEVSYSRPIPKQPIPMSIDTKERHELWVTHALDAKLAGMAGFRDAMAGLSTMNGSGNAALVEAEQQMGDNGFVIKSVTSSDSKVHMPIPSMMSMFGSSGGSRSTMEFTELREEPVAADAFVLPKDFTEREMMNPNAGSMPDLNQVPGGHDQPKGNAPPGMPDLNQIPH